MITKYNIKFPNLVKLIIKFNNNGKYIITKFVSQSFPSTLSFFKFIGKCKENRMLHSFHSIKLSYLKHLQTQNANVILKSFCFSNLKEMADAIDFFTKANTIEFNDCQCWNWEEQDQVNFEGVEVKNIVIRDCWIESNVMIKKVIFDSGIIQNLDKISFINIRGPGVTEIELLVDEHHKKTGLTNYEIIE